MFDRIVVNVVDVPLKISVVADGMLPVPPLPESSFTSRGLAGRARRIFHKASRKPRFDHAPTQRVVCIARRQRPDGVQVIWENADRDCLEREAFMNRSIDPSQQIDVPDQKVARPVGKRNSEKECAALDVRAPILRHVQI